MGIDARLAELGIELPPPPKPVASYVPVTVAGGLAFVAGQVATEDGEPLHPGHVGAEVSLEDAQEAARHCALQALAALREELRDLEPQVANGASDLLVQVFGDSGRHARAAVGVAELPLGAPVEVTVVAEIG
jgi:enamine deaminase RidA (YjgF/YER057c/UK114 family)